MRLSERYIEDGKWMVEEVGELVLYRPTDGEEIELYAVIDRAAVNPPEYGYEQTLTSPHHSLTFVMGLLGIVPRRGDVVVFDEVEHTVHHVGPITDTVQVAVTF
jgi:hypothetical protein